MQNSRCIFLFVLVLLACAKPENKESHDWPIYRGNLQATNYSPLDQINKTNIYELDVAWVHHTGDEKPYTIECNPIVVNGMMYITTPSIRVEALNPVTGELIWQFDPYANGAQRGTSMRANRGVAYWEDGDEKRIFIATGTRIFALDANTGKLIPSFGEDGSISMNQQMDRDVSNTYISATTPATIFKDLLIIGSSTPDGRGNNPPGDVRAFDVRTGKRKWIFHTIPHPGELGYESWPKDAWKTAGGNNSWAGISVDPETEIAYIPTGSPAYDHFGFNRHGDNLFGNSVIAVDANTGAYKWHFQTVRHDLWDYDLPAAPSIVETIVNGDKRKVVVQPSKQGFLYVFDAATGEIAFGHEDRPVPQSTVPGEWTAPTQPFPLKPKPYAVQGFTEEDITDLNPEAQTYVKTHFFDKYGPAELYPAPSFKGDIYYPQFNGGTDWGGCAVNPNTGIVFVNASNEPEAMAMIESDDAYAYKGNGHLEVFDPEGFPISKRPWGTLTAIDLNTGDFVWQEALGTYPELEKRGLPPTGTFNIGGPLATAGGLVFIGATKDARFRAFDQESGEVIWTWQLPVAAYATPATYMVDGIQYLVIAAGGGGKPGTEAGDAFYAFKLKN